MMQGGQATTCVMRHCLSLSFFLLLRRAVKKTCLGRLVSEKSVPTQTRDRPACCQRQLDHARSEKLVWQLAGYNPLRQHSTVTATTPSEHPAAYLVSVLGGLSSCFLFSQVEVEVQDYAFIASLQAVVESSNV